MNIDDKIKNEIHSRLHPKTMNIIGKLFLIHVLTAVITLSVCPQFGLKSFHLPINLMNSFMVFGMSACNFLCGLFFTTTSVIVASIVLDRDMIRALKYKKTLAAATLILSSIGFFGIMAPNLFLEFSLLWLLGAVIGVIGTLEISSRILARV